MRKKGNLFQRMLAVLLCGMLMLGMTSQALPTEVFAAGTDITEESTQAPDADAGSTEQVTGTEEPALPESSEIPENSGIPENSEMSESSEMPENSEMSENGGDVGNAEQAAGTEEPESTEADEEQATEEKSDAVDEEQTEATEEPAVQESTQVQDAVNGDELSIAVLEQNAGRSKSYGLWVNGIQVTDANAADVLGDSTVSYAPDTNVLTLNGANLTTAYEADDAFVPAAIYADFTFGVLKLNIQGTNTITTSGSSSEVSGICAMDSMEFSGDGSLTVTAVNQSMYGTGYAVYSLGDNVTITGGTYSFTGTGGSNAQGYGMFVGNNMGTVYVNGGTLITAGAARPNYEFAIAGKLDVSGYADCEVIVSMNASGTPETDYDPAFIYPYIKVMPWIEPVYDENGFFENGKLFYQPAVQADDGYYELTNAGNLYWFAELMKSGEANGYENVRLTEDITIPAGMNWKPITVVQWGYEYPYQGIFDGNGKSISNLSVFRDETEYYDTRAGGLFKTIGDDGVVKNLTMRNASIKTTSLGGSGAICETNDGTIENCCNIGGEICVLTSYAGGIAGINYGKIVRCFNTGTVYAQDENNGDCVGGICGYASEGAVIENCYNTGTIGAANVQRAGGVTGGYETGTKITDCYNVGTVTASYAAEDIGCYVDGSQPSEEDVKNNYYLAETESDDGGRTAEQFVSGEVAWLLNEGNTDGTQAFYQTCGEGKPAFTGQTVYRVMRYQCPGDTNGKEAYSNADENITGEHSYGAWTVTKEATEDETGLKERSCGICGDTQTEVIPKTGGLEPPDSGRIEVDKEQGENAPVVDFETPENDIIGSVLTPEEQNLVTDGTDVKIILTIDNIDDSVSEADKQTVTEKAGDYTVGQYLDINLYKIIGDSRTAVFQTNRAIRIVIDIPDSLKNTDAGKTRTYTIVRVHNGVAELLPDLDSAENTITIETNQFSTYALAYHDTDKNAGDNAGGGSSNSAGNAGGMGSSGSQTGGNNSGSTGGNSNADSFAGGKDNEPKTGDATPVEIYATVAMVAGFSYLYSYFGGRKRGMTEEEKKEIVSSLVVWGRKGGKLRRLAALVMISAILAYYHSIGKKVSLNWKEAYGE